MRRFHVSPQCQSLALRACLKATSVIYSHSWMEMTLQALSVQVTCPVGGPRWHSTRVRKLMKPSINQEGLHQTLELTLHHSRFEWLQLAINTRSQLCMGLPCGTLKFHGFPETTKVSLQTRTFHTDSLLTDVVGCADPVQCGKFCIRWLFSNYLHLFQTLVILYPLLPSGVCASEACQEVNAAPHKPKSMCYAHTLHFCLCRPWTLINAWSTTRQTNSTTKTKKQDSLCWDIIFLGSLFFQKSKKMLKSL